MRDEWYFGFEDAGVVEHKNGVIMVRSPGQEEQLYWPDEADDLRQALVQALAAARLWEELEDTVTVGAYLETGRPVDEETFDPSPPEVTESSGFARLETELRSIQWRLTVIEEQLCDQ